MASINFEDLLSTGAHFGHVTRKWHPSFKPYILMEKNGIHIINLEETVHQFEKAAEFIRSIVDKGGEVLFVGTKKQAREIVQQEADRCGMFYVVERWLGGTLTNFMTIKKSIKRLHMLEKEGSSIYENLTKKEVQMLNRERIKLADQHRGIKDMRRLPDAVIVVDSNFEVTAVAEAKKLEIPVVSLVDSNTDPTKVDYPIPGNDDSIRTIQLIISSLAEVVIEVRKEKIQIAKEIKEAKEAEKAEKAAIDEAAKIKEAEEAAEKVKAAEETAEKSVEKPKTAAKSPAKKVVVDEVAVDKVTPKKVTKAVTTKKADEAAEKSVEKPKTAAKPAAKKVVKKPVKPKKTVKKPAGKKSQPSTKSKSDEK